MTQKHSSKINGVKLMKISASKTRRHRTTLLFIMRRSRKSKMLKVWCYNYLVFSRLMPSLQSSRIPSSISLVISTHWSSSFWKPTRTFILRPFSSLTLNGRSNTNKSSNHLKPFWRATRGKLSSMRFLSSLSLLLRNILKSLIKVSFSSWKTIKNVSIQLFYTRLLNTI
jgi:hypothetical protein